MPTKGTTAPEAQAQGAGDPSSHLQLFLIKVAQPLQGGHLIEAIQEGFGLLFHAPGETPVGQQPKTKDQPSAELRRTAQVQLGACQEAAVTASNQLRGGFGAPRASGLPAPGPTPNGRL